MEEGTVAHQAGAGTEDLPEGEQRPRTQAYLGRAAWEAGLRERRRVGERTGRQEQRQERGHQAGVERQASQGRAVGVFRQGALGRGTEARPAGERACRLVRWAWDRDPEECRRVDSVGALGWRGLGLRRRTTT